MTKTTTQASVFGAAPAIDITGSSPAAPIVPIGTVGPNPPQMTQIVPDIESWISVISLAIYGSVLSLNDYMNRCDKAQMGSLVQDFSFYHKRLRGIARPLTSTEIVTMSEQAKTRRSLDLLFSSGGKTIYFPLDQSVFIVNDYLSTQARDPISFSSEGMFSGADKIEIDEYLNIVTTHSNNFSLGSATPDLDSFANYAISGLVMWGPFTKKEFMNRNVSNKNWFKMLDDFESIKGSRHDAYRTVYSSRDEMLMPNVAGLTSIVGNIDYGNAQNFITDVGNVVTSEFLNTVMSSRSHVATLSGRDSHENKVFTKLIDFLAPHAGSISYCDAGASSNFPNHEFHSRFEDPKLLKQALLNGGAFTGEGKPAAILLHFKFQMNESDVLTLITKCISLGIRVFWVTRYLSLKKYSTGILAASITHTSPFYDYTIIQFAKVVHLSGVPEDQRYLIETIHNGDLVRLSSQVPTADGITYESMVCPVDYPPPALVLFGTASYRSNLAQIVVGSHYANITSILEGPTGLFSEPYPTVLPSLDSALTISSDSRYFITPNVIALDSSMGVFAPAVSNTVVDLTSDMDALF